MKIQGIIIAVFLLITVTGCKSKPDSGGLFSQIRGDFESGYFNHLKVLADSLKELYPGEDHLIDKADSLCQIAERTLMDFSVTEVELNTQLKERISDFSALDKEFWESKGWLEWKTLNGEKRYFNRAVSNLILLKSFYLQRELRDSLDAKDPEIAFRKKHTQSILKESQNEARPVVPVEMTVNFTLTVDPDAVPAGETVRCWLPYPKESHSRQQNIRFISASAAKFLIAPDSVIHRTIYMEANAEKGKELTFEVSFSYLSFGTFFKLDELKLLPYDKSSDLYREYTSEQLPHICFTSEVKRLADCISDSEMNPYETVRKIYYWFSSNIPWAGALEYSIIPNIPEYVLQSRRGDCGMQTFLFMSMLRYKGIPVKWQSGWMVPPVGKNLHDWCEVYFEGIGWVPVDISYGLQYSDNLETREFFISGIDSYRLIVNDGVAGALYPQKEFLRSEPFDFQRGEVEWSGGNLYFDKWDYKMEIDYKN